MYFILIYLPSINRSASAAPQGMSLLFIFSEGISGSWKQSPFEIYIVLRVVEYWDIYEPTGSLFEHFFEN